MTRTVPTLCPTEHEEQVALFQWADTMSHAYPELCLLHAIPNAGAGAQRGRAGWLKAEGVKPGVPDVFLPVPIARYHGLWIELKRLRGGVVSEDQTLWHRLLVQQGYRVAVCKGWVAASEEIMRYLKGKAALEAAGLTTLGRLRGGGDEDG